MRNTLPIATPLLTIFILLIFLLYRPFPATTLFWETVQNIGHIPLFGVLGICFLTLFHQLNTNSRFSRLQLYLFAFFATSIFAGITELIQTFMPSRNADISDIFRDLIGASGFLIFIAAIDRKMISLIGTQRIITKISLLVSAALILLGGSFPLIQVVQAYEHRDSNFPRLMSFDHQWPQNFLVARGGKLDIVPSPDNWPITHEKNVGRFRIDLSTDWPFLRLDEVIPNWKKYGRLMVTIYSEAESSLPITILIDDKHANKPNIHSLRFSTHLKPGFNQIQIPFLTNNIITPRPELDLTKVNRVWIAFPDPEQSVTLYIGEMKLEHINAILPHRLPKL